MTIQGDIDFRGSTSGIKFDSKLEGRRRWFTIFHVKVTKKVTSILTLGNKYSFFTLKYLEAKKIMQMSKVIHFKFLLKTIFHMG